MALIFRSTVHLIGIFGKILKPILIIETILLDVWLWENWKFTYNRDFCENYAPLRDSPQFVVGKVWFIV